MKNRWIVMILVLSFAMNSAVVAVVGYHYFDSRSRPDNDVGHAHDIERPFYEALGLSTTQLKKMKPLADSFHERLKSLYSGMSGKKNKMISLLEDADASPVRIETLRLEMAAIQDTIQKTVITHVLEVKKILSPDQRERFFNLLRRSMNRERGMFIRTGEK